MIVKGVVKFISQKCFVYTNNKKIARVIKPELSISPGDLFYIGRKKQPHICIEITKNFIYYGVGEQIQPYRCRKYYHGQKVQCVIEYDQKLVLEVGDRVKIKKEDRRGEVSFMDSNRYEVIFPDKKKEWFRHTMLINLENEWAAAGIIAIEK